MDNKLKEEVLFHVKSEYPKEACGLIAIVKGKEKYYPCTNLAENKYEDFVMNPVDYYRVSKEGDVQSVIHSHPNESASPSKLDQTACDVMGINWWIVSYPNVEWCEVISANKKPGFIGRQFVYGILDCFTLVEDYYRDIGINLKVPQWNKDNGYEWDFWEKGKNYYIDNYKTNGFKQITDGSLKANDALLMNIRSPISNHCAIYIGDNRILHHLAGRLSCRDQYGQYYRQYTTHTLRHEQYC